MYKSDANGITLLFSSAIGLLENSVYTRKRISVQFTFYCEIQNRHEIRQYGLEGI